MLRVDWSNIEVFSNDPSDDCSHRYVGSVVFKLRPVLDLVDDNLEYN